MDWFADKNERQAAACAEYVSLRAQHHADQVVVRPHTLAWTNNGMYMYML